MADMKQIIEDSFTQYAGAVLQSRALVDVRDCLKPSARQIFYCLYTDKFLPSKPFKKTLKAIGSAARMYIHGDSSCEGVIMRAGQPFAMRYPLIEVEGNEGNLMQSGNWAAPRYTASRLSKISEHLFEDIEKETINDWRDNYDDTEQYPMVLPSRGYYNIVNGTQGIGIGAASSIPQFNIRDVNKALETLLFNPDCSFDDIYCAPDFCTGGILLNENEVKESLKNGTGAACKLRSVVEFDTKERCFIVTEIPYSVYTNTICEELEKILMDENNNPGVDRFNDLTGEAPLIKIYLTKKANPDRVLKYLYKNTSLQSFYSINMTMLENGKYPKVFGWKEALQSHINHEKEVYRRGFEFDLAKIEKRIHIIDGLLICIASIDEVVKIIKSSTSTAAASSELQKNFLLDAEQAKAVLDMKLSRLANLEVKKLEDEKDKLIIEKDRITAILNDINLFNNELIKGWNETSKLYGDARRTRIMNIEKEAEEVMEQKQLSLSFTNKGAIFVTETSTLYSQRRNGVGSKFKLEKDEYVVDNVVGQNTDVILFFTNKGNYYHMTMSNFQIDEKQYISNFFPSFGNETIQAAALITQKQKQYIMFVTRNGIIKKSELSEYNLKRNTGAQAIKLDDGDELVSIFLLNDENIGIMSKCGQFIRLDSTKIRPIGRVTRGVIGMKLNPGDEVAAARRIKSSAKEILSVSSEGLSKRTFLNEFSITATNTKGVKIQKAEEMCDFMPIDKQTDVLIISSTAQLRLKIADVPLSARGAIGNKVMKLSSKSEVMCISTL